MRKFSLKFGMPILGLIAAGTMAGCGNCEDSSSAGAMSVQTGPTATQLDAIRQAEYKKGYDTGYEVGHQHGFDKASSTDADDKDNTDEQPDQDTGNDVDPGTDNSDNADATDNSDNADAGDSTDNQPDASGDTDTSNDEAPAPDTRPASEIQSVVEKVVPLDKVEVAEDGSVEKFEMVNEEEGFKAIITKDGVEFEKL